MIVLGIILVVIFGWLVPMAVLLDIGIVLIVLGVILELLGVIGYSIGPRRHYF